MLASTPIHHALNSSSKALTSHRTLKQPDRAKKSQLLAQNSTNSLAKRALTLNPRCAKVRVWPQKATIHRSTIGCSNPSRLGRWCCPITLSWRRTMLRVTEWGGFRMTAKRTFTWLKSNTLSRQLLSLIRNLLTWWHSLRNRAWPTKCSNPIIRIS